ncbi:membrane protein [Mycobacterium phage Skinny]|uniref:Uncharacterized protein n=6 Tax=Bongovirus bongo TaxID=1983750 RepID=A0A0M4RQT6_9CAUD|nr:hypothetical protein PEGLEG_4 [Mycobacterium phage PegLeg]YP_009604862.1 hypothetical protein FDH95_gp004 [Mycobacterium phage Bongo]ALF00532.1 hypothetical protein SEA_BRICOLE_4 [Mycobacterium phage Bricole]AXQ52645.1 hypothetical protein SEA_IPHANE7_4 [Mycobacterium phage IPhane7]QDH93578.1 hypothetical protein SEA_LILHOMIEP_4 [Mycobacterium phage LilhomieP]QGJ93282.1 hypothetical protein SEA_TYDAWG_4 [Mycobacterium phage TyDawg]QUU29205.1 hypothetical protein [Mycobacterium phage SirShe
MSALTQVLGWLSATYWVTALLGSILASTVSPEAINLAVGAGMWAVITLIAFVFMAIIDHAD